MSNSILPHLISDSPPPLEAEDEDFEDEFGDFKVPDELSFDSDILPLSSSLNDSKNHVPIFSGLSNDDNKYEIYNKSRPNINSEPPSNYFSIWEKIENDVPEYIDSVLVEKAGNVLEDSENEEPNVISTSISNDFNADLPTENPYKSTCNLENGKKFKDYFSPENIEYLKGKTEDLNSLDSIDSFEGNIVPESEECERKSFVTEKSSWNETQSQTTCEQKQTGLDSKDNNTESVEETNSEHINNLNITNEKDKIPNHSIESTTNDIYHPTVSTDNIPTDLNIPQLRDPIDFSSNIEEVEVCESKTEIVQVVDEDYDDFADFTLFASKNENEKCEKELTEIVEDEFHDFGSFQNTTKITETSCVLNENVESSNEKIEDNDDFDNFTSYAAHKSDNKEENLKSEPADAGLKICSTAEEAFRETQNIVEKLFPKIECTNADYLNYNFVMNNSVFDNLKDITETNALTYQWDKSMAQKNILKTLNIDVRNILYGPNWNSGVPIFAANLCEKPLEPIKSELTIPPSPQKNVDSQVLTPKISQFDWAESGLSNLQDSMENVTKEKPRNSEESSNVKTKILQPSYVEQEKFTSQLNDFESTNEANIEDFGEFASYQGEDTKARWNMLPLRESHISIQPHQGLDTISKYFQDLTMGKTEAFDLDQLKPDSKYTLESFSNNHLPIESTNVFNDYEKNADVISNQINLHQVPVKVDEYLKTKKPNTCDISTSNSFPSEFPETNNTNLGVNSKKSGNDNQEDEFTDFQSSLPPPFEPPMEPALLEPLKPAILQPEPIKHQSLKIEWPEPGLDEKEINRIVNGVMRKNSTNEIVMHKFDNMKSNGEHSKSFSQKEDQEDWSDFMSVKEPLKSRTSTPDLPLSVFNLGSIQTNRVSAPYVAPNGVVHSPSKTTSLSFPVINRNIQNNTEHLHQQPFITSQAFNALSSNTTNNLILPNTHMGMSGTNKLNDKLPILNTNMNYSKIDSRCFALNSEINGTAQQHIPLSINHSIMEDDDWGDFVSAPSNVSQSNLNTKFCQPSSNSKTTLGYKSGSIQKPPLMSKNTVVRQQRKNLPVISTLPDLDFISPKSRSTIK